MFKHYKVLKLFFLSLLICVLTVFLCYFLAERFFFDKFFYQKSLSHGYIQSETDILKPDLKDRTKYLNLLDQKPKVLGTTSEYTVLIIGDSYAWGEGVRYHQSFPLLLENMLNKIRPTRVITVATPGWNISEYTEAYLKTTKAISPDLTIFSLVHNDVLLNQGNNVDDDLKHCLTLFPQITPVYEPTTNDEVASVQNSSWANKVNLCHLDLKLAKLPTDKSIYFITDNYTENPLYDEYTKHLRYFNKHTLNSNIASSLPAYSHLWKKDNLSKLYVSKLELHPSRLAHQLYSDVIYQEIIRLPQFGFKK